MRQQLVHFTSRITAFAKCGNISDARKVFDEMPHKDTIAWNAMISGYSHLGFFQEALSLFTTMGCSNLKPDHFTYTTALSASAGLKSMQFGRKLHGLVVISGWSSVLPVNNALIDMYGKCLNAEEANKVFEEMELRNEVSWCSLLFACFNVGLLDVSASVFYGMPRRVVVAWNTIIAGYAKWGEVELCLDLFKKMLEDDTCSPDRWTLSTVMNACGEMNEPCFGHMVHGLIMQMGWDTAVEVYNSILSFYVTFGDQNEVLKAVEAVGIGVFSEVSWNTSIDAYMKMGDLDKAYLAFQGVPEKNLITWTSMITGYMRNGHGECALKSFVDMMQSGIQPDEVALGGVLHACSILTTFSHGRMVHGHAFKSGLHSDTYVGNGLVNMYAKCGDICGSDRAFGDILEKDLVSWNTMLFSFGMHGCPNQTLHILDKMVASRIKPDKVTSIGVLMACSHLGLIDEGLNFFVSMASQYGISPEIDHVACVVDMLGRCGELEKAKEVVNKYVEGANNMKESLLGIYSCQGDLSTGAAELAEQLQIVKPNDEMSYVLLSNLYCASGQWKQSQTLRKAMAEKGVRKMPGCSWIEVANRVTPFVAGSKSFPGEEEVGVILHILEHETRQPVSILCLDGAS